MGASVIVSPRISGLAGGVSSFPAAAFDALVQVEPDARLFTEYEWGGYGIYRLYDRGGRVFVDGRNDMYPSRILDDYVTLHNADGNWEALLSGFGVNAVVLRPAAPLVSGQIQALGWCEVYRDALAVVMLPRCP